MWSGTRGNRHKNAISLDNNALPCNIWLEIMKLDIQPIKSEAKDDLERATDAEGLAEWHSKYLGKKGILRTLTSDVSGLSTDEKKELGRSVNELRAFLEETYAGRADSVTSIKKDKPLENFYKTLPGKKPEIGHLHLITQAIREINEVFSKLGFIRVRYPEVEWDYYSFEALNMPKTHPARDEWETFFVDLPEDPKLGKVVITPHTSNGQIREMLLGKLPIRMLNISRCGRRQIDVSHVPTFYQFEGLVVDKDISITHLKGVLEYLIREFFGKDTKFRLPFLQRGMG